jgi:CRP/FNR family cyclic AMP-dependent transcriptional regulator
VARFNAQAFLASAGPGRTLREYRRGESVYQQGEPGDAVFYIQQGGVRLSARSTAADVVVANLAPGDFFGEGCLRSELPRSSSATAVTPAWILRVGKDRMTHLVSCESSMSGRLVTHLVSSYARMQEDLAMQLFRINTTTKGRGIR